MPRVHIKSKVSPAEFRRLMDEAGRDETTIDGLRRLVTDMVRYEVQYGMSTEEFYERFMRGEMGDAMDFIRWAGRYELYCRVKDRVDQALEVVYA
jgi:hypothetical protein